jgi:Dyp-type peroxidase family
MATINLNAVNEIDLETPLFYDMLESMQANILKHHGRDFASHIFMKFNPKNAARIKLLIGALAESYLTTAKKQLHDAERHNADPAYDGGAVITFSLSHFGYVNLGIDKALIPDEEGFLNGLKSRNADLNDGLDKTWDAGFKEDISALLIVADSDHAGVNRAVNHLKEEFPELFEDSFIQKGQITRKPETNIGIEHFGYADGVSQPVFLKEEIRRIPKDSLSNDVLPLNILLVKDPGTKEKDSFGSYLVFRKLEQNVKGFKELEDHDLPEKFNIRVKDKNGKVNPDLAGAMLVGRFEDGTEVVNESNARGITRESDLNNNFNFENDPQGLKCPFFGHTRLVNPRTDIVVDGKPGNALRITRRAIPYNDNDPVNFGLENPKHDGFEKDLGLLFMCYQSNISKQFEIIQKFWASAGNILNDANKNIPIDSITGQGTDNTNPKTLPLQWGQPEQSSPFSFGNFVTMKGGEYFFTASLSFLASLK